MIATSVQLAIGNCNSFLGSYKCWWCVFVVVVDDVGSQTAWRMPGASTGGVSKILIKMAEAFFSSSWRIL
jgi:hypothetical protein